MKTITTVLLACLVLANSLLPLPSHAYCFPDTLDQLADDDAWCQIAKIIDKHVTCLSGRKYGDFVFQEIICKDSRIANCVDAIKQENSLEPLKLLWHMVKNEGTITEAFIQEFCIVLFISYQAVFSSMRVHSPHLLIKPAVRVPWFEVIMLYAQLSSLPLHKVFDALEECWVFYQKITEDHQVKEDESWIMEYWWIPATCAVYCIVSFLRWLKTSRAKESRVAALRSRVDENPFFD